MLFHQTEKSTSRSLRKMEKKDGFHQPENHLSTSKNELFLSKLFSLYSNNGFYQQRKNTDQKILFPLGRKSVCTSRVNDINKYVSSSRKSYKNDFHQTENPSPPARMKDFVKKHFSTKRKKTYRSLWKMKKKNDFHQPENPFPQPQISFHQQNFA